MKHNPDQVPTWDEFLRPLLELAAKSSIMTRTATLKIADQYNFSEEIRNSRIKSGQTHMHNRAGWAMSSLKKAKFITQHESEKFTYQITDKGRQYLEDHKGEITDKDLEKLDGFIEAWKEASRKNKEKKLTNVPEEKESSTPSELIESAVSDLTDELRADILGSLLASDPYHFERIVLDVLLAMGYGGNREEASQVTQKSNDGGIDGIINEDRLGLDVIYVQAKRYQNRVGRVDIQNFVGALAGHQAHKGVFITTSDFNDNAIQFAKSVPQKVILIDGDRLADLMIEHNVGVSTENVIEIKKIDSDYFL